VSKKDSNTRNESAPSRIFWGIALVSLAGFALQIILTRLFSVLFFYNFVFIIISLAILGIGLGASFIQRISQKNISRQIHNLAWSASGGVLLLTVLITLPWAFDPRLIFIFLALLVYGFIGAISASLFRTWSSQSGTLYAADLSGGGFGALAALGLLTLMSGINALLLVALLLGIAGGIFAQKKRLNIAVAIFLSLFLGQNLLLNSFQINPADIPTPKPLTRQLTKFENTEIVHTEEDALGRVDVLENTNKPDQKLVFMDGAAGSMMLRYPETQADKIRIRSDLGYFPFLFAMPENILIIGPGGGKDILFAHLAKTQRIEAVEISGGVAKALEEFSAYNGNLASLPEVNLVVDEGRSYLRRSDKAYEMIYLSEVTSLSTELAGYMLAENYIYTTEAVKDYLGHLTDDGWLVFKLYDEFTLTRAFTTVMQALVDNGISEEDAARHVAVFLDPQALSQNEPFRSPLLMVSRNLITAKEGSELLKLTQDMNFIPVFIPHALEQGALGAITQGKITLNNLIIGFERGDMRPTSDNAPFFYEFSLGLPALLNSLLTGVAAFLLLALFYLFSNRKALAMPAYWQEIIYFFGLGVGFLLIEAGILQSFSLFLGHPTLNLSVILMALLLSGGLGSRLSQKNLKKKRYAAFFIAALVLLEAFTLPALLKASLHLPLWGRIAITWVAILPLGIFLGMPFPHGLQKTQEKFIPLAWGINGVGSVVGGVVAMALAMTFGFQAVFLLGGGIYLFLAGLSRRLWQ
jgi:MFS family permease